MSVMAQHAASPPLAHSRAGTVYLVLDDFGGLGWVSREPTRLKPTPRPSSPISYPVNIGIPSAWWRSTSPRAARDVSADIAREVRTRARELEQELPAAVRDFVERADA
jgi:hypothetical protein